MVRIASIHPRVGSGRLPNAGSDSSIVAMDTTIPRVSAPSSGVDACAPSSDVVAAVRACLGKDHAPPTHPSSSGGSRGS